MAILSKYLLKMSKNALNFVCMYGLTFVLPENRSINHTDFTLQKRNKNVLQQR